MNHKKRKLMLALVRLLKLKFMDKLILKNIAKRWCKAILMANDITDEETMELLSQEEQDYLLEQVEVIANRITDRRTDISLNDIIKEYYSFEN